MAAILQHTVSCDSTYSPEDVGSLKDRTAIFRIDGGAVNFLVTQVIIAKALRREGFQLDSLHTMGPYARNNVVCGDEVPLCL